MSYITNIPEDCNDIPDEFGLDTPDDFESKETNLSPLDNNCELDLDDFEVDELYN